MTAVANREGLIDWRRWRERWDRQQAAGLHGREERFALMLKYVERFRGANDLRLVDLCCGCGSIAERALQRFPSASVVAVDWDPVMLELGRRGLPDARITWLEADIRQGVWLAALRGARFDAVLTSTSLHWLQPEELARLYRDLAGLIVDGGVLLNADHTNTGEAAIDERSRTIAFTERDAILAGSDTDSLDGWWEGLEAELRPVPRLAELLDESERRSERPVPVVDSSLEFHRQALKMAGFREVAEVWRHTRDAVLLAVR